MKNVIGALVAIGLIGGGVWYFMAGTDTAKAKKTNDLYSYYADIKIPQPSPEAMAGTAGQTDPTQPASAASTQLPTINHPNIPQKIMNATLKTNMGDITIQFMESDAPNTVANFIKLAKAGFYDGTKFHRVIAGFMIQGGDPLTKDDSMMDRWGTGDPGYKFNDEIHANNQNNIGTISMANSGPNTNGSQFFINTANNNFLDTKHTVFGTVTAGADTVKKIESVETNGNDRPLEAVVIQSVVLN